ncbi:glycosyltransferase [Seonamhaeicola marinus]|uniref:Glycosyltransferase family 4 protein n=1 Tax=Seonamhaeicola marinus TaxID=1912246 RepID=A0A5D0JE99_9FLAO|nr:glycosyltransferase [Seonamhaeicola marinus]TYA92212.1 glycosyltransferase family 4 protein [Seonamhaeicola marinus]
MPKTLLIIGFVWPEPKSSAAGSRMLQLIETFRLAQYNITFASACAKTENAINLEAIGVSQKSIELNSSSFDDFVKALSPDVVMFDRFMTEEQFGWRVTENCPNALKVLDTEDLHCLRRGRQQAYKDASEFDMSYLFNDTAKREIASIYRCDISLIISEVEMEILKSDFKVNESLLYYVPFLLDQISEEETQKIPEFKDRNNFITIGNFLHEPNYNGVLYLKETIWPLIKKEIPNAEIHIYGAYASQKVNQLQNINEGFFVKGFAEDVNEVMQKAKVCLVPVRFGAGLKGKIIDAMVNGIPCVTTKIGAEGMFGGFEVNGFVEDNPEDFAKRAIEMFQNETLWYEKQQNGFKVLNERFNKNDFQKAFLNKIEHLTLSIDNHRLQNFTGAILQHHSHQSTKFMSRWIEEKNK